MRFSAISILVALSFSTSFARENFQFGLGDKVNVLSDRAFRKIKDNSFEATGNVVVIFKKDTLYGEKASLNLDKGDVDVEGNVRYINQDMTLFGTKLHYNIHTTFLSAENAKVVSDNYTIVGKSLERHSGKIIVGKDVEYSTCRDCPESWSIYGKDVHITLGEYVRIKHAYLKVNDVVVMYIPYIVFPIKKGRESGLLFPKFSLNLEKGATFQQPVFWVLSPSNDITLTPSFFGKRGYGNEFQYRQVFGEAKWMEINSLQARDAVYLPEKINEEKSGDHYWRQFSSYEQHFNFGNWANHHLFYSSTRDLDIVRDFRNASQDRIFGSEIGGGGFFEIRQPHFNMNVESYVNRNLLFPDAREFDNNYVQEWPRIDFSLAPYTLIHTKYPGLKNLSFGADGDFVSFKQNHQNEGSYIRNAERVNASPYLAWDIADLGPVRLKHVAKLDYQHYRFPGKEERTFTKRGIVYESEVAFEIQKIFGFARREEIPIERVDLSTLDEKNKDLKKTNLFSTSCTSCEKKLIGELPSYEDRYGKKSVEQIKSSYRHTQEFKLKHYYLTDQKTSGSRQFGEQITKNEGQFDYFDALRSKEHELNQNIFKTSLPLNNTIEIQWNNAVHKKTPKEMDPLSDGRYLRDNFSYEKISYFNLSQGYDFNVQRGSFEDGLTRLNIETGFNWARFSISGSEYYFYKTNDHVAALSASRNFDYATAGVTFDYDSSASPSNKKMGLRGTLLPVDVIELRVDYKYDLENKRRTDAIYGLLYSPYNHCWKFDLQYSQSLIDKQVSFNFLINFNNNSFTGLGEAGKR